MDDKEERPAKTSFARRILIAAAIVGVIIISRFLLDE